MYYCFALKVDSKSYIHSGVHRIFFLPGAVTFIFLPRQVNSLQSHLFSDFIRVGKEFTLVGEEIMND